MNRALAERVLAEYKVAYTKILPVQKGYRNHIFPVHRPDGSMIQLTFYKPEPQMEARIRLSDAVSLHVAKKGFPTRVRVDQRTAVLEAGKKRVFCAMYTYLPGHTLAWEAYTRTHLKALGKTLSDLHAALADFENSRSPFVLDELDALLDRMVRYFSSQDVVRAMREKLSLELKVPFNRYRKLLEGCRRLPGQQLHMDFVRGNILFHGQDISGILDFEKTSVGHPLFDVARTLAFLLVDCKYKTEAQVWRYFLQSGYVKRGAASLEYYPGLVERLVEFFLLHDFYKFLRHNPYEALESNEHFTRTVSILTREGVLHYE